MNTPQKYIWDKKMGRIKGCFVRCTFSLVKEGIILIDPLEKAETLAEAFSKNLCRVYTLRSRDIYIQYIMKAKNDDTFRAYNVQFTLKEIQVCISELPNISSPGLDRIHNRFIKNMNKNKVHQALGFINKSWKYAHCPVFGKKFMICPIGNHFCTFPNC